MTPDVHRRLCITERQVKKLEKHNVRPEQIALLRRAIGGNDRAVIELALTFDDAAMDSWVSVLAAEQIEAMLDAIEDRPRARRRARFIAGDGTTVDVDTIDPCGAECFPRCTCGWAVREDSGGGCASCGVPRFGDPRRVEWEQRAAQRKRRRREAARS